VIKLSLASTLAIYQQLIMSITKYHRT